MAKDQALIVEDSSLQQQIFKCLAQKAGVEPYMVATGQEAIAAYRDNPNFFIIFMDVKLIEMDGMECTSRIREIENATGRHVHIVAITAQKGEFAEKDCIAAGMDEYLSKPFSFEQFDSIMQRLLAEKDRREREGRVSNAGNQTVETAARSQEPNC